MEFMHALESQFDRLLADGTLDAELRRWSQGQPSLRQFRDVSSLLSFFRHLDPLARPTKELVLQALASLARQGESDAATVVTSLFLPLFRKTRREISCCYVSEEDLEAEMLAGLWEAIATEPSGSENLIPRIFYAVKNRAWKAVRAESRRVAESSAVAEAEAATAEPEPDPLVAVASARDAGAVSKQQADLLASTALAGEPVAEVARRMNISEAAVKMRLWRAERKFIEWVRSEAAL